MKICPWTKINICHRQIFSSWEKKRWKIVGVTANSGCNNKTNPKTSEVKTCIVRRRRYCTPVELGQVDCAAQFVSGPWKPPQPLNRSHRIDDGFTSWVGRRRSLQIIKVCRFLFLFFYGFWLSWLNLFVFFLFFSPLFISLHENYGYAYTYKVYISKS